MLGFLICCEFVSFNHEMKPTTSIATPSPDRFLCVTFFLKKTSGVSTLLQGLDNACFVVSKKDQLEIVGGVFGRPTPFT